FYSRVRAALGPFASQQAALDHAKAEAPDAYWGPERQATLFAGFYQAFDGTLFGKMPRRVLDQLEQVRGDDVLRPLTAELDVPTLLLVSSRSDEHRQAQKLEYA